MPGATYQSWLYVICNSVEPPSRPDMSQAQTKSLACACRAVTGTLDVLTNEKRRMEPTNERTSRVQVKPTHNGCVYSPVYFGALSPDLPKSLNEGMFLKSGAFSKWLFSSFGWVLDLLTSMGARSHA